MADTSPDLWSSDVGRQPAPSTLLRISDTAWHVLMVPGARDLGLRQKFQEVGYPVHQLEWTIVVGRNRLTQFPNGLILQYAVKLSDAQIRESFGPARFRSLGIAHLKRDLWQASFGSLPVSARRIVFLDARGWEEEVIET